QASSGFVGLSNTLVDSPAFASLTYGPAVKVLVWFWQKAEYPKQLKKKGLESPVGKIDKILNNGKISFLFQEAGWRGLSSQQFSHALKDLFRFGFIDVAHLGRGIQGDYTKFALSDRWKKYGTPEWEESLFPENFFEGFRKRSKGKVTDEKSPLPTVKTHRYESADFPRSGENSSLKTAVLPDSQRRVLTVSVDLPGGTTLSDGSKKKDLKGQGSDHARARRDDTTTNLISSGDFDHGPWAEDEPLTMAYGWGEEATL
ncbi:MAG: hypothetical protein A2W25_13900, partial [candidate division Zixibacteria bacterium RBG_16_53_22]